MPRKARTRFSSRKYEDASRYRVKGGYVFQYRSRAAYSDGGDLILQQRKTGSGSQGEYTDTAVTVSCPKLRSGLDVLIDRYTSSGMSFFEKLDAISAGLDHIAIYPRSVNGYTAITSSGYYITVNNGVCTPSSVSFYYNKAAAATGTVTVYCYDSNNTYIRTYTETISGSKTIYPQAISGYTALSTSGQYITFSNGVCSPAAVTF